MKIWKKVLLILALILFTFFNYHPSIKDIILYVVIFIAGALVFRNNEAAAEKIIDKIK